MAAILLLAAPHGRAADGRWIPVGFDDPRSYTCQGFLACVQSGDLKSAFERITKSIGSSKEFAAMIKSDPALQDIRSFELVRVTPGGGTATLEARTKDGAGRTFPVSLRLKQSAGSDEGWTIAAVITEASAFPSTAKNQ